MIFVALLPLARADDVCAATVIANQTNATIAFELTAGPDVRQNHVLGPGQLLPVLGDRAVRIRYMSGSDWLTEQLEQDSLYYFLKMGRAPLLHAVGIDAAEPPAIRPMANEKSDRRRTAPRGNTISVKILVDQYHPGAEKAEKDVLALRVRRAADFLEPYCGLKFQVVEQGTWTSDQSGAAHEARQQELAAENVAGKFDLVLGFETPINVDQRGRPQDNDARVARGKIKYDGVLQPISDPFARSILIAGHDSRLAEPYRLQQVIVALAGFLGAVPSPQPGSVMNPIATQAALNRPQPRDTFLDPLNALAIAMVAEEVERNGVRRLEDMDVLTRNKVIAIRNAAPRKSPKPIVPPKARGKQRLPHMELYNAAFADGVVFRGASLEIAPGQGSPTSKLATARIGGRLLLDEKYPVVWVRRQGAVAVTSYAGFVEFHGGDRLPGESVEFRASDASRPAHLIVKTDRDLSLGKRAPRRGPNATGLANPDASAVEGAVRVRTRWLRRIVNGQPLLAGYEPRTLVKRDGQRVAYRSLKLSGKSVRVLRDGKIEEFSLEDIAELHFPDVDQWQAYYEQLAVLDPACRKTLIQCETDWGLRATAVAESVLGSPAGKMREGYRPAWCLDPLWPGTNAIGQRRFFQPTEVPLSLFLPTSERRERVLAAGLPWQLNRSVAGGSLASGGFDFAWGFGVQATSQLEFDLPQCATGFRSWVGLDSSVGQGGCARVQVRADTISGKPLFESGLLLGSATVLDTGVVALATRRGTPWRLILVVDSAHANRPAGADPWDVRDQINWLEPRLLLDQERLQAEVARFSTASAHRTAAN